MPSDPISTSVWTRPRRSRGEPTLSQEQIVKAALDLLDTEGIDGLSMRRLGARLGSGATSIYWHVANKDELLDLAIDAVMGEVRAPTPDEPWRPAAEAMVRELRDVLLRHGWITGLFGVRPNIGPNAMRLGEGTMAMLVNAGFGPQDAAYAASLLSTHAIGSATLGAAWRTAVDRSGLSEAEMNRVVVTFQQERQADYPQVGGLIHDDIAELQRQSFEYGLARVLDGLAATLPA